MSRKVIDISNSLEFINDYNNTGVTGSNFRISTSQYGELFLYSTTSSTNSSSGAIILYNGGLSINNTTDSSSITAGGSLTVRGGASFEKSIRVGILGDISNIISTNTSIGVLNATGITAGNINFSGNLYKNGSLYISSQWNTGIGGILSYTSGSVGIGTTSPGYTLDVSGTGRLTNIISTNISTSTLNVTGITSSNINFTGNLYKNGNIYISSQWNDEVGGSLSFTNGSVGIGIGTPLYKLDVNGNLRVSSTNLSVIISARSDNVFGIQNTLNNGNSSVQFTDYLGNNKLFVGYANPSSSLTSLAASSYILSDSTVSLKLIGGNQTAVPVILNANDNSVSITTTTDAINIYSGALKVSGGASIQKMLWTNNIYANNITSGNVVATAVTCATLALSIGITSDNAQITNINATVITAATLLNTNAVSTNISSATLVLSGGITSASAQITNVVATAVTCATLNTSTGITSASAQITNINATAVTSGSINASNLVSSRMTIGNLITNNLNLGMATLFSGSFIPSNNTITPTAITGLVFDKNNIGSFTINLSVSITTNTTNICETFVLEGNWNTQWSLYNTSYGGNSGIVFSITSTGQIQYTSTNITGFTNSIFRFFVNQIVNTGSYIYTGLQTQGTFIINTMQILSTDDSNTGVNNGSLYVAGGVTVSKTLYALNISCGNASVTSLTTGTLISTNITSATLNATNAVATNISSTTLILTTGITTVNAQITNAAVTSLTAATLLNTNMVSTNISSATLVLSTGITSANAVITTETVGTSRITGNLLALGNSNTLGNIITTGGNVGINNVSPSAPLHVTGTIATAPTGNGLLMGISTDNYAVLQMNSTTGSCIDFSTSGVDYKGRIMYNNANNYIELSTNGVATARFQNDGSLISSGDIAAFGNLSDRRLKQNIQNLTSSVALDTVKLLRPVTFDWRGDIFNETKRNTSDIGFIAQEVESLVPLAVSEYPEISTGEIYKNIKHERLLPYLTGSIQQLDYNNRVNKDEINNLKSMILNLIEKLNIKD